MTASLTPPSISTDCLAPNAPSPLAIAVQGMRRAIDRVGTRSGAYELLDVAEALEQALPVLRLELRARCGGELPMELRIELSNLARAATSAHEFGTTLTCIVPTDAPSEQSLVAHLDEWLRSAEALELVLEAQG
jgi:hypothetical protein